MKTLFSLAFALLLAAVTGFSSPNLPTTKNATVKETLSLEIKNLLGQPNLERMGVDDVTVKVQFVINSDLEVRVIHIQTDNEALKDYIESRLDNQKIKTKDIAVQENYFIPLTFKPN